jgi:hypothetical protein
MRAIFVFHNTLANMEVRDRIPGFGKNPGLKKWAGLRLLIT